MKEKTVCERRGHQYLPLEEVRRETAENGKDTLVFKSFYCSACCDIQERQVAIWKNFIPRREK